MTENPLNYNDILDAFNESLRKYPDNPAVSFNDKSYTYAESAFIAGRIAEKLTYLGVKSQDHVSFLVERSEKYLWCILGILSVGGVYVPLDDAHPDERIEFILEDTASKVVIVSDETYKRVKALVNENVLILNISDILHRDIKTSSSLPVVYGDLACILYTSGSSGIPKGVKVTRKSVINFSEFFIKNYNLTDEDVFALYASAGFDVAYESIFASICSGACINIVPDEIKLDMDALNNHFIEHGVTFAHLPAQVAKLFISQDVNSSLKVLCAGGEKLGEIDINLNYRFVDTYGPTETFIDVTSIDVSDKIDDSSIGNLFDNTKAYILDNENRRVPLGAVGELCIAGYPVAEGYLNRDDETAYSFIDNPFDRDDDYSVLYRTGDMVKVLCDGTISLVGRRDNQVKIRGNRVELSEVEAVIRDLDYVKDATVKVVKHENVNELVVYLVVSSDIDEDALRENVRDYIGEHKPAYMLPSFVIALDNIPLTVNGKVDERALPDIDFESLHVEYVAPESETEKLVVNAFENVFNHKVGIYDDFIRLGGDSLKAIQISSQLYKFGIKCNANSILNSKTPFNIAKSIDENKNEYGFYLAKKGSTEQNMFILPPVLGASFSLLKLVNNLDFDGNVYLIDDFKFNLSKEEIKNTNQSMTFNYYYEAIKDVFQDGDIIAGYSAGCLFVLLLAEKLEQFKKIDKCILIDGTLSFTQDEILPREEALKILEEFSERDYSEKFSTSEPYGEFRDKLIEIMIVNSVWDFPTPEISSHVLYLATSTKHKEKLDNIAPDNEFILIDSNHDDIIDKDVGKIIKYFKK